MSGDAIKRGDMVMVVRGISCCGGMGAIKYGTTFTVSDFFTKSGECKLCGKIHIDLFHAKGHDKGGIAVSMLKKVDPPAEGDTLPTRADLGVSS